MPDFVSPAMVIAVLLMLFVVIGGGLAWHEHRFYGPLAWRRKPPLEAQNRIDRKSVV